MDLDKLTIALTTTRPPELSLVGGKAASLIRLKQAGFSVPDGCVLTSAFFLPWTSELASTSEWRLVRDRLYSSDTTGLHDACEAVKRLADGLKVTKAQQAELEQAATVMEEIGRAHV